MENGTDSDAVVIMIDAGTDKVLASFYVRTGEDGELPGIPDGTYRVCYALGRDWDSEARTFTRSKRFARYDDALTYATERKDMGGEVYVEYPGYKLTLHKTAFGNATTSDILEEEFRKYCGQGSPVHLP